METKQTDAFKIIGISVVTSNADGQAARDIPALWNRFFAENISAKIQDKLSEDLYCIYTDYVKDHTEPYTTILGYRVSNLDRVPEGLTGKVIDAGRYTSFMAKGKISEGIVFNAWLKIWDTPIDRAYTADFEIYGAKSQDPENAEVEIMIAVR